ncbi:uncharacterized protein [Aegilops tauschii subsp. strangulata]|uniref:uncharacterized protein n=1 Tax=Aegilops tauschii subsp. strangulata TaxID=200361 RepID=UPI00098A70B9|nr:uncharacterized protein LOC109765358 [Aegilops tauschii subsp. strangulata]
MASGGRRELFSVGVMNNDRDLRSTSSPASKMKRSVTIRPKAMLSVVLAEAGLPEVKYKTYASYRGGVAATAIFWPSQSRSSTAAEHMRINGDPAVDANEAMQNAATWCLEHLQATMGIEFDCPQMQKIKTEMKYLSSSVDEKDRNIRDLKAKVEKRNMWVNGLTKGWGSLADDLLGSAYDQALLPTGASVVLHFLSWLKMHSTV